MTPLEALESLKNLSHDVQYASKIPSIDNELKIIETALKRIPDLEKALDSEIDYGAMMNKQGLELKRNLNKACKQLNEYGIKLKALDIIVKHKLMNYIIKNKKCANMYHLTNEEIDLLKDVL